MKDAGEQARLGREQIGPCIVVAAHSSVFMHGKITGGDDYLRNPNLCVLDQLGI